MVAKRDIAPVDRTGLSGTMGVTAISMKTRRSSAAMLGFYSQCLNLTAMTRTTMNDGRDGLPGAWLTLVSVPPVVVRTTGHCGGQTVIEAHQLPHLSYRGIADNRRSFSMNISSSMNFYFSRTSPRTYSLNIHSDSLGC